MLLGETQVFGHLGFVAANHPWGRLFLVFGLQPGPELERQPSPSHPAGADLHRWAIESEWLQEDSRRHERLDRQLSTVRGNPAQLPAANDCPGDRGDRAGKPIPAGLPGGLVN